MIQLFYVEILNLYYIVLSFVLLAQLELKLTHFFGMFCLSQTLFQGKLEAEDRNRSSLRFEVEKIFLL